MWARVVVVLSAVLLVLSGVDVPLRASTLATLELSADRGMPGQELSFRGWYYNDTHPVRIRWNTLDGPVLATVTPDTFGPIHNHFRSISGTLRIPPDAQPGPHLVVATQDFAPPGKITWGVPVRTRLHVGQAPERTDTPTLHRPSRVAISSTPGAGHLILTATAGAAFAGLIAAAMVLMRRREPSP
jgi:hypothetical protein